MGMGLSISQDLRGPHYAQRRARSAIPPQATAVAEYLLAAGALTHCEQGGTRARSSDTVQKAVHEVDVELAWSTGRFSRHQFSGATAVAA
jgi:hypothetical protein